MRKFEEQPQIFRFAQDDNPREESEAPVSPPTRTWRRRHASRA